MNLEGLLSKESVLSSFVIFMGAAFGMIFPDLDLGLLKMNGVIQHRSLITHSFLLGWIFLQLAKREKTALFHFFALGIFIGFAVHLSFDLFPRGWRGFALIYLPFIGNLRNIPFDADLFPPFFSFVWILGNIYVCLVFAQRIIGRNSQKLFIFLLILLIVFILSSNKQITFWFPFFTLLACLLASFKEQEIQEKIKRIL